MKKLLLLGAATLMSASAAWADVRWFQVGDPVTDISQMKNDDHDGLYCIQVYKLKYEKSGFLYSQNNNLKEQFTWSMNDEYTIDTNGEASISRIFHIAFDEGTDNFTVQSLNSGHYLSIQGNRGYGKHNAYATVDGTGVVPETNRPLEIAKFTFDEVLAEKKSSTDPLTDYRVLVKSANAFFDNVETNGSFYWFSNDGGAGGFLTYHQSPSDNSCLQVAFIPVKACESRTLTIKLPGMKAGEVITQTAEGYDGHSAESIINQIINEFGGMTDIVITSDNDSEGSLIVSEDNTSFTVTGNWIGDFEANQVYRLCVNPNDEPSALRYMLSTGEIRTKVDGEETLSRLIPERLWFFKATTDGENTYTMHNLYNTKWAIHFEGNENGAVASYTGEATPTVFEFVQAAQTNQFYLKIHGTENAYVSDNNGNGIFTINNTTPNENCLIQYYPLESRDLAALDLPADSKHTVDVINLAVEAYNAQNIAAALRRIEYWGGEELIGWQPGRFNNANNDFLEKLEAARALQQQENPDPDLVEQAVKDIDFRNLIFNEIKPGFYRFKNKQSGLYMSSISKGQFQNPARTYMELVTEENAQRSNTVFYVDGTKDNYTIISFDTGLVLPDFDGAADSWLPVLSGDAHACSTFKIQHRHLRGCILCSQFKEGHRHIYGGANHSKFPDCVLASSETYADDHQWYLDLVEELPVPLYNSAESTEAWASIYSPIPLQIQDGEAVVHTGNFSGTSVWKKAYLSGDIVPARTPVLLDYKGGAEDSDRRDGISYIYLKVLYGQDASQALYYDGEAQDPVVQTTPLEGGMYAIAPDTEKKHYYTLHETDHNNFHKYTESYIPGFKAHIAIDASEDNPSSFAIVDDPTSGIDAVVVESTSAKSVVYDLQGRKLAAPAKGINIVNGKKVLVK